MEKKALVAPPLYTMIGMDTGTYYIKELYRTMVAPYTLLDQRLYEDRLKSSQKSGTL